MKNKEIFGTEESRERDRSIENGIYIIKVYIRLKALRFLFNLLKWLN